MPLIQHLNNNRDVVLSGVSMSWINEVVHNYYDNQDREINQEIKDELLHS